MVTVSACMIVRNERNNILNILGCLVRFCDEINVVDTGSDDGTVEMIRDKFPSVKLFHFDWVDDFSAARNFSFAQATKDYIFWTDGDDFVPDATIDEINRLRRTGELSHNDVVSGEYLYSFGEGDSCYVRRDLLLRRSLGFRWTGRIHEYVSSPLAKRFCFDHSIKIEHHKEKDASARNLRIFQKMEKEQVPFTVRDMFYYAGELYFSGQHARALEMYHEFLLREEEAWTPDVLTALWRMHLMYSDKESELHDEDKDWKTLLRSLRYAAPRPDFCCAIGDYHLRDGRLEAAEAWYTLAFRESPLEGDENMLVAASYATWYPMLQLCVCHYRMGETLKAEMDNEVAAGYAPEHPSVKHNREFFENLKS